MITHRRDGTRTWPILPSHLGRVLDLGCGDGDALREQQMRSGSLVVGIDVKRERLAIANRSGVKASFCCGSGDALPFPDGCFDAVISRVALPYMNIPHVLSEIFRVLKPSGEVWLSFHGFSFGWSALQNVVMHLRPKDAIFRTYVIGNGLWFEWTGLNFAWPFDRRTYESVQSENSVRRALQRAGFERVAITQNVPLVVVACKSVHSKLTHDTQARPAA
jgi:SAM-dependent methyltransferase